MTQLKALVEEMTRQGWPNPSTWLGSFRPGSTVWWGAPPGVQLAAKTDLDDKFTVWRTTFCTPDVPARIHADRVVGAAVALEFLRARLKPGEIPCLDLPQQGWRRETDAQREARLRCGDFAPTGDIPFLLRLLDEQRALLIGVVQAERRTPSMNTAAWLAERARATTAGPDWTAAAHRHDPQFRPQF